MIGFSREEFSWFSETMVTGIHDEIEAAAALHDWNFVEGISTPFLTHGYCASDPWVVRIGESLESQSDYSGWVHPDRSGHDAYADALETSYFVPEPGFLSGVVAGISLLTLLGRRRTAR